MHGFKKLLCSALPYAIGACIPVGVFIYLILTSPSNPEPSGPRWECRSRLERLAEALSAYAEQHGQFPDHLSDIAHAQFGVSSDDLVCPDPESSRAVPYVYVGAGEKPSSGRETVILYEPPGHHGKDGGHLMFADGWVSFMNGSAYRDTVEKSPVTRVPDTALRQPD